MIGSIAGVNGAYASVNVGIGTTTPNSTFQTQGSFSLPIRSSAASTLLTASDYAVVITNPAAVATLPTAVDIQGRIYVIKNLSGGSVNVLTTGAQGIDGFVSLAIANGSTAVLQSTGGGWVKIN